MKRVVLHTMYPAKIFYFTLLFISIELYSCKKFVQIDDPINPIVSDVVFSNDATATGSVTGIYSEMMNSTNGNIQFSASGVTLYSGMCADELRFNTTSLRDEFFKNKISEANHGNISLLFWDRAYKYIYTANLCLEGLNKSASLSLAVKNRLIGESKFIRAFCFFQLVNLFGNVPLPVTADYRINAVLPRAERNAVYQQIINDLIEAKNLLPTNYDNAGRVRPNKWAAAALLARVYLYTKNWTQAELHSSEVIAAGNYSLPSDADSVFLKGSAEAIWQLMPVVPFLNTFEGNVFIPPSANAIPGYILQDGFLTGFETNDQRKIKWTRQHGLTAISYPYKYKVRTANIITEYYLVLRLAEQYLIRSEARAEQNNLADAIDDLNKIRTRAGLLAYNSLTQAELLTAIMQERKVELFAEWGHRWFDLKRTNRADAVLSVLKPATWRPTAVLWPIPVSQLTANPALVQNEGY